MTIVNRGGIRKGSAIFRVRVTVSGVSSFALVPVEPEHQRASGSVHHLSTLLDREHSDLLFA